MIEQGRDASMQKDSMPLDVQRAAHQLTACMLYIADCANIPPAINI
jgi:hypothetical protein